MKNISFFITFAFLLMFYTNCSQTGFQALSDGTTTSSSLGSGLPGGNTFTIAGTENNVVPITVGCGYVNEPCVSVTICQAGTTTCQTIPNLLLDTGSYGLRVFKSALTITLGQMQDTSGRSVAECVGYADGTGQWGPVKVADISLGQHKALNVPMQVVDSTFPTGVADNAVIPTDSGCSPAAGATLDAATNGYNGILGVGLFTDDCGSSCANSSSNNFYYACTTSLCSGMAIPTASQVSNPVSFMTADNNGVIVQLPNVADAGAVTLSGWLILGIGTQADNTPPTPPTFFKTDTSGNFQTSFNGTTRSAFIDSGSNGLFFPKPSSLTDCSDTFFCPTSQVTLSATQIAASGGTQGLVTFNIGNADDFLANTNPNMVFNNLGADMGTDASAYFDWGLPFFMGRTVYVGTENKVSTLGTGPYWAY